MRFIAGWDEVLVSMTSGGGGELMGVSVSVWSAWLGGAMVAVCISIVGGCGGLHAKKREERERRWRESRWRECTTTEPRRNSTIPT